VNSDSALNDQMLLVLVVWTLLHLAWAALALLFARGLLSSPEAGKQPVQAVAV
jgi:hypothetical protein